MKVDFPSYSYMNYCTNKIRFSRKTLRKFKKRDKKSINMIKDPIINLIINYDIIIYFNEGFDKIIFLIENLNSSTYKQDLKYYGENLNKSQTKFF